MDGFIQIEGLTKTFGAGAEAVEVLKGVDLGIRKGEIYGVVGFSGAGKSTLVRCINRLEQPDAGTVRIGGKEITALSGAALNTQRQKIGMIFQQFNLFDSKTVFQNIVYPLRTAGWERGAITARVDEVLELVGLTDKRGAYPGQLSGGQKQRVGIARALANNPEVLLSDEATSALDPQTTMSVLDLLREINQKLGLTIIMITHELEVVKYTCDHVAILEDGRITEQGTVGSVFLNPQCPTGKVFLQVYTNFREAEWEEGTGI